MALRNKHLSCFWLLSLFLTLACQKDICYHSYQPINSMGWHRNDTIIFSLDSIITENNYELQLGVRHKDSYPYRDLWLTINQDTFHIYLADSIGHWIGSGIGELRHFTTFIPFTFHEDSTKELRIVHIMQDNPLIGIKKIGLSISGKYVQHQDEETQTIES